MKRPPGQPICPQANISTSIKLFRPGFGGVLHDDVALLILETVALKLGKDPRVTRFVEGNGVSARTCV